MSTQKNREKVLRQLLEDNFVISKHCRKAMEAVADVSLKYYFQNVASRRSQFAMEIGEEIAFYGGKEPYLFSGGYDRSRKEPKENSVSTALKKALKLNKESLQKYQAALCQIYDGSCREILLRHKAFIENCNFELKSLKTLIKYSEQVQSDTREVRNHS